MRVLLDGNTIVHMSICLMLILNCILENELYIKRDAKGFTSTWQGNESLPLDAIDVSYPMRGKKVIRFFHEREKADIGGES